MNSNQDFLSSISNMDVVIRKKVCQKINDYLSSKGKIKKKLSDDEINNYILDRSVINNHIDGLKYRTNVFKAEKIEHQMEDSELKDGYKMVLGRGSYLEVITDDSPEAYYKNKILAHKFSDPKTRMSQYAKMFKDTSSSVIEFKKYKTHDEKMKACNGNLKKFDYGFNAVKISEVFKTENPSLINKIAKYNNFFLEDNEFVYENKLNSSPLNLFYPIDNLIALDSYDLKKPYASPEDLIEINKIIKNELPNLEQEYNEYYKEYGYEPLSDREMVEISNMIPQIEILPVENKIAKIILEKFNLDYEYFKTKEFVKGKGNDKVVCSIQDIIKEYKETNKISEEYSIQDISKETIKDAYDTEERLIFEGEIYEYKYRLELAEKGIPTKYPDELVNNIKEIVNKYDELEKLYPNKSETLDIDYRAAINKLVLDFKKDDEISNKMAAINADIKKFEENNLEAIRDYAKKDKADTLTDIERRKQEKAREEAEKIRIQEQTRAELTDLYNQKNSICKNKSNYDLAKLNKALNERLNMKIIPNKLKELENTTIGASKEYKDLMEKNHTPFIKEEAREALCMITINNKRIDDYNHSSKFMQWWRKKSIAALKEQNELLIKQFEDRYFSLTLSGTDLENLISSNRSYENNINEAKRKSEFLINKLYENHTKNVEAENDVKRNIEQAKKENKESLRNINDLFKKFAKFHDLNISLDKNEAEPYKLFDPDVELYKQYEEMFTDHFLLSDSKEENERIAKFKENYKANEDKIIQGVKTIDNIHNAEQKGKLYEAKHYRDRTQVKFNPGDVNQEFNGPNIEKGKVITKENQKGKDFVK